MSRIKFAGLALLQVIFIAPFVGVLASGGEMAVVPAWLGYIGMSLWMVLKRLDNAGISRWWSPLFINPLGTIVLALQPPDRKFRRMK